MAGEVSKKDMDSVLMQVMMAAKNVRAQRDCLLQLHRRLQRHQAAPAAEDRNAKLGVLATDLFKVYYVGLEAGARMLMISLKIAVEKGARFDPNLALALTPDEQLHDALLAQQLPDRPTTQTQAIDRVMAAFLGVKLLEEHLLPRCVECLIGGRAPVPGKPCRDKDDDPVASATEGLAKVDLSDGSDVTATAKTGSKPRHAASSGGGGGDVDKALDYLHRANTIASLAVKHIDLAVTVLSRFLDPKDAASLAEFCDRPARLHLRGGALSIIGLTSSLLHLIDRGCRQTMELLIEDMLPQAFTSSMISS